MLMVFLGGVQPSSGRFYFMESEAFLGKGRYGAIGSKPVGSATKAASRSLQLIPIKAKTRFGKAQGKAQIAPKTGHF